MTPEAKVAVRLDDVHCTYHVYAQRTDNLTSLISRRFRQRTHTSVEAVRGVTLDVHVGEVFGIVGHNGAGKTTLLRAIGGFMIPSAGQVLVSSQPQRIDVSWALNSNLSGRENVELGLLGLGFSPSKVQELAPAVVEFADLGEFINLPIASYSSGMRQRLGFAIATESSPKILLLDEALAVGDKAFRAKGLARVEELQQNAGTIVMVSHNLASIRRMCDRVLWMRSGEPVAIGAPDEIVDAYEADNPGTTSTPLRWSKKDS